MMKIKFVIGLFFIFIFISCSKNYDKKYFEKLSDDHSKFEEIVLYINKNFIESSNFKEYPTYIFTKKKIGFPNRIYDVKVANFMDKFDFEEISISKDNNCGIYKIDNICFKVMKKNINFTLFSNYPIVYYKYYVCEKDLLTEKGRSWYVKSINNHWQLYIDYSIP